VPPNTAVQFPSPADIDPNHVYTLVELIDIAQCRNPATRVAWEEARQAAIKVGIERAAYLPALTAGAVASYERIVIPLPPAGWVPGNFAEVVPQLGLISAARFRRSQGEGRSGQGAIVRGERNV
jgi:outer membrane protein TolC